MDTFNPPTLPKMPGAAYAIQALSRGEASEDQQKLALKCIVEEIANVYEMSYDPEKKHTDFNEGRRSVGRSIANTVKINLSKIAEAEKIIAKKKPEPRKKGRKHD